MSITRNSNRSIWCDYHKMEWGQKSNGGWFEKAQQPATWISTSTNGKQQFLCDQCRHYVEAWNDGTTWDIRAQQEYRQGKQEIDYGF